MPGRYSTRRRFRPLTVVNSLKNVREESFGISGTNTESIIAKAVNTPLSTVNNNVSNGCIIKAVWIVIDVCGTAGSQVTNSFGAFLMKNPGANLTCYA